MKRTLLLAASACALLTLSPLTGAAQRPTPDRAGGSTPVEMLRTGHIAVQVRINGKEPVRLAFDTGSPLTFINRKTAVKLGLMTEEAAKRPMMFGMGGLNRVQTFSVGGAEARDLPVMILDHPIVEMISQVEGGIEGLVGMTFFGRYKTTIDYAARRIDFAATDYQPKDVMASVMGRIMQDPNRTRVASSAGLWGLTAKAAGAPAAPGVAVSAVFAGSAAAEAGLKPGDRILTVDGRWTDSLVELHDAAAYVAPGETAELRVKRGGKELTARLRPRAGF
jgi:hypothetical protein